MPIISKNGVDIELTQAQFDQLYPRPSSALTPIEMIRNMVRDMDPAVLLRYPGHVGLIGQFLDAGSTAQALGLIGAFRAVISQDGDTEALAAIDGVITELQAANLM